MSSLPFPVRIALYGLLAALALQIVLPLLLLALRDQVLFFPAERPSPDEALAELRGLDARLFRAERSDGRVLTGYDARPVRAPDAPVLLYFHGNAGNAAQRAPVLRMLVEGLEMRVVMASYSGYGGNPGSPSETDLYADALAFHDALTASGVAARKVVVYGESIGGVPALYLATERPCAGVVTQSTLSSLSSMAGAVYGWLPLTALLTRGMLPNDERAGALDVPLLVVHGTEDRVVPFGEAERLLEAAPGAELLRLPGAGHNDIWAAGGTSYLRKLAQRIGEWTDGETAGRR